MAAWVNQRQRGRKRKRKEPISKWALSELAMGDALGTEKRQQPMAMAFDSDANSGKELEFCESPMTEEMNVSDDSVSACSPPGTESDASSDIMETDNEEKGTTSMDEDGIPISMTMSIESKIRKSERWTMDALDDSVSQEMRSSVQLYYCSTA